jgi:hypothetical protein
MSFLLGRDERWAENVDCLSILAPVIAFALGRGLVQRPTTTEQLYVASVASCRSKMTHETRDPKVQTLKVGELAVFFRNHF